MNKKIVSPSPDYNILRVISNKNTLRSSIFLLCNITKQFKEAWQEMCSNALSPREHNQPPRRTSITLQFDLHDLHQQYKKKWTTCQILEVLHTWIILWALSMLFRSECMPEKPVTKTKVQPICIRSHRILKTKLLLTEKKTTYYPKVCIYDLFQSSSSLLFSYCLLPF